MNALADKAHEQGMWLLLPTTLVGWYLGMTRI